MVPVLDLWLAVLLATVFVFVVSSVIHMALPLHLNDYIALPDEDAGMEALGKQDLQPRGYMFPRPASMADMGKPETLAKYEQGPVGFLTILPNGPPAIGKSLLQWFVLSLVVSLTAGYVTGLAVPAGTTGGLVFRMTASIAFLAYGVSNVMDSIWKGVRWSVAAKFVFDGLLYALATGAAFHWFWPEA